MSRNSSGTGAASVLPTCQQRKPEGGEADDGTAGSSSHGEPPTNDAEDTRENDKLNENLIENCFFMVQRRHVGRVDTD